MDHFAGTEAIIETHPSLVIQILAPGQDVLAAHEVRPLVHHPSSTLHTDGVAPVQVGVEVRTVAVTFVPTTLEVLVLVENYLDREDEDILFHPTLINELVTLRISLASHLLLNMYLVVGYYAK